MGWVETILRGRSGRTDGQTELSQAVMLGVNWAVGMAVFTFAGYWIDQKRGGGLIFTVAGILLGLAYGAYEVWKLVRALNAHAQGVINAHAARHPDEPPAAPPSAKEQP